MPAGSVQTILVCSQPLNPCPAQYQQTVTAYSLDPGVADLLNLLLDQGGIDWPLVADFFGAGLFMYALGLGLGLVINVVKKAR